MPSGRKLTKRERAEILRLAGLAGDDGRWLLTYSQIAARLELHRCTIYRWVREAAVRFGEDFGAAAEDGWTKRHREA